MTKNNLRKRAKVSYFEPDELDLDEYIFCTECGDYVVEYCAVHGPLLVIPDTKVSIDSATSPLIPHAALTIPNVYLHIAPSIIPGAGLGVFSTLTLPADVRFGPYSGDIKRKVTSPYCWQIYTSNRKLSHVVDASSPARSNWMRYVNCSRHWNEQNLLAYQYRGEIYYRTVKIIPRNTELLVYYGTEYAKELNIDIRGYNDPKKYDNYITKTVTQDPHPDQKIVEAPPNKLEHATQEAIIRIHFGKENVTFEDVNNANNINENDTNFNNNAKISDNCFLEGTEFKGDSNTKISENILETVKIRDDSTMEIDDSDSDAYKPQMNNFEHCFLNENTEAVNVNNIVINTNIDNNETGSITNVENNPKYNITDLGSVQCLICGYNCYSEFVMRRHILVHDPNRRFQCHICHYKFPKWYGLKRHINCVHLYGNKHDCTLCKSAFPNAISLKYHKGIIHNYFGDLKGPSIEENKHQILKTDNSNINTDSLPDIMFNNTIDNEIDIDNKENKADTQHTHEDQINIDRNIIDNALKFANNDMYRKQIDSHTNVNLDENQYDSANNSNVTKNCKEYYTTDNNYFKCNSCPYKTVNINIIRNHIKLHDENRPNACRFCQFRFTKPYKLKNHIYSVHTYEVEELKTKCPDSDIVQIHSALNDTIEFGHTQHNDFGKINTTSTIPGQNENHKETVAHNKVHTETDNTKTTNIDAPTKNINNLEFKYSDDDKFFHCFNCDFSTPSIKAITKHILLHDPNRKYVCPICNYRYINSFCMRRHIMCVHSGEKNFKCQFCEAKFAIAMSLKCHVLRVHNNVDKVIADNMRAKVCK